MDANSNQPSTRKGSWWFGWLIAAIVLPAIGGAMVFQRGEIVSVVGVLVCIAGLIQHFLSSVKLGKGRWFIGLLLVIGGWGLMAAAFFFGCVATYPLV